MEPVSLNAADTTIRLTAKDGVPLDVDVFPAGGSGPVVVLVHGIASHRAWYRPLAHSLAAEGVSVWVPDRRGSGTSGGPRGHMDRWPDLVDDLAIVRAEAVRRNPGRALHGLGISLGGVIVLAAALLQPAAFASLSVFAPGIVSRVQVPLLRRLRVLRRSWTEPTKLYDLPFGVETLVDRPEWREALGRDPLRTTQVSARFLVSMFRMQRFVTRKIHDLAVPLHALLAGRDALIDNERLLPILARARPPRLIVETVAGAPHMLPAAMPRADLLGRIVPWFRGEAGGPARVITETPGFDGPREALPAPPPLA